MIGYRSRHVDEGSALVVTLMVTAAVLVIATTILTVTVSSLSSVRRTQDAAGALDAADAGVSQALAYLRSTGPGGLVCSPSCTDNPWGNSGSPATVELPGATDQSYSAWIEPIPDGNDPAFFRVHSEGSSVSGVRAVQVDVELTVEATGLPLGVFARSVQGGGNASVTRESVYSTGCVWNRSKIDMTGIDVASGLPAAVHSSKIITDANGNTPACSTSKKAIHDKGPCNTSYPYDHDALGGSLAGTGCSSAATNYPDFYTARDLDGNGTIDVNGSYLRDDQALFDLFDIDDEPLSPAQMEQLEAVARSQGNYRTTAAVGTPPDPIANPHSVLFFDLTDTDPGGVVNLNDISGWGREKNLSAGHPGCQERSLMIIIRGGNARMNSNRQLAATLVLASQAPHGEVIKANGTADFIGTIYADKINLVGTVDISLDDCFLANLSPGQYTASVTNYLEIDR